MNTETRYLTQTGVWVRERTLAKWFSNRDARAELKRQATLVGNAVEMRRAIVESTGFASRDFWVISL